MPYLANAAFQAAEDGSLENALSHSQEAGQVKDGARPPATIAVRSRPEAKQSIVNMCQVSNRPK